MIKSIKHVISVSGGKDSCAILLLALEKYDRDSIIPIFCDTGNEHEDVYAYLAYLELALEINITRLKADFSEQIAAKRRFIAADQRTKRKYERVQRLDDNGIPMWRMYKGQIELEIVWLKDGSMDLAGFPITRKIRGRRTRWTNKAKRRALSALYPTGNPFLDLCMLKGRCPSRKAQFCTQELKTKIAVEFQMGLADAGNHVISWQGIRRDESQNRASARKFEYIGNHIWIYRPIVDWSAMDVFAFIKKSGIEPNPLYKKGMGRVGCMPCINARKDELNEIGFRFPAHIARIAEWEEMISRCSKRGFSTWFHKGPGEAPAGKSDRRIFSEASIGQMVIWANTSRGGDISQIGLFPELPPTPECSSSYGLCDQGHT